MIIVAQVFINAVVRSVSSYILLTLQIHFHSKQNRINPDRSFDVFGSFFFSIFFFHSSFFSVPLELHELFVDSDDNRPLFLVVVPCSMSARLLEKLLLAEWGLFQLCPPHLKGLSVPEDAGINKPSCVSGPFSTLQNSKK